MRNTELPPGWDLAPLADLVSIDGVLSDGDWVESKDQDPDGEVRLVQLADVGDGFFRDRSNRSLTLAKADELRCTFIREGDVLVARMPDPLGRACIYPGGNRPAVTVVDVCVIRPGRYGVDNRWLMWAINSPQVRGQISSLQTGTTRKRISRKNLETVQVAVPPLAEQRRVVEILEDHLSRLDAAVRDLEVAHRKVSSFRKAILLSLVPGDCPESWEVTTVGEAGAIDLGRQRHPDWHHGPEMHPYLRVANVFEDRIDTADVMEMDFSGVFDRYKLGPGDILLNEGQSPHLVGRPALYRGEPAGVAFTNSLLRFRARPDVLPEWALMVFRRHLHARRFMREVRITTNIAHLSSKRLKAVEFPIPPMEEQKRLVQRCEELLTDADALERGLSQGLQRAKSLRKALLARAFDGALVPQNSEDEPASALLEQIRVGRASSGRSAATVRGRQPRKAAGTTASKLAPAPSAVSSSVSRTAVQQEFEL
ncbi:restriction endonuclease subunit S [Streptomyces sp. NPDC046237]|uniref:restriction endonuclease subunit S n=1 Tax=Streptomyces sp. NPDC046237 TaxID=3154914 RepID=UPI0034039474